MTRIFISHSHADEAIADLLIDFLGEAMEISKKDIRCTSDPNHGLDFSSSSISDQLKTDLTNADALIIIATIDSLRSPWILFEVGSFWTTDKLVAPIIGSGLTFDDLPGPLRGYRRIEIEKEDVFYELGERAFINKFRVWESKLSAIAQSQEIEKLEARIQDLEQELTKAQSQLQEQELLHSQELHDQAREINLRVQKLEQELAKARSQVAQFQESAPREEQLEAKIKDLEQKDREIMRLREKLEELSQRNIESLPKSFKEYLGNDVELEMIAIPGGKFMMGSPEGEGNDDEKPQHKVTVQAFHMGKYSITQAQYQQIIGKNPSDSQGDNQRPVDKVSWDDAVEFCQKLSKQTRKEYRLPTEAEWEYACRAGTTTKYNFGDDIKADLADYSGNVSETTDIVNYRSNVFGLYDMHRNIFEWCQDDWHDSYENSPNDGSAWFSEDDGDDFAKVLRGALLFQSSVDCRSADRYMNLRISRLSSFGFRVVCIAPRTTWPSLHP